MIPRLIEQKIIDDFKRKKVSLILGPRQVGKSTLLEKIREDYRNTSIFECDYSDEAQMLEDNTRNELMLQLQGHDMIQIDEAQRIKDVGLLIKKIGDLKLNIPIMVTGSSALEFASGIFDTAVGRVIEYHLFPFTLQELAMHTSRLDESKMLKHRMVWGLYPEIVIDPQNARSNLKQLVNDYLWKDLLTYKGVKRPEILRKLVQALALQIGSEVSYNELSNMLKVDAETIETYIGLLEKCFIVFRLPSFSRNQRNEIKKGKKVYFWDNGIRNAIIEAFTPINLRTDVGALWENLMVSERMKNNSYTSSWAKSYFWRTHDQAEIDYIEEGEEGIQAYEFKFNPTAKAKIPASFAKSYPGSTFEVVTPDNYWNFVCGGKDRN